MITRDFDLWITQGHTKRLVFNANQYDQGETWRFRILGADGNPIVPTTAAIIGQKKDGHAILVNGTIGEDGRVTIVETEQMTACAGLTEFELLLNGETHGTANFTVQVEKRPGDDADLSDSDLSLIQDAVDAAETIVEVIGDGDPSEVIGEHVDAWLDAHPEATTTVEDGAITAPKINNSLWDKLLVSEEASGAVASFDDGADDVPVSSLKVALEPVQLGSGDPSPSNIRPIIASNGKNILKPTARTVTAGDVTYSVASDGAITLTGNCTSNQSFTIYTGQTVPKTAWYTCSTYGATNGKVNGASSASQAVNAGTAPSGFAVTVASGTTYNETFYLMLNEGNTAQPYQPYQGIMVERCGINQWDEQWESGTYLGTTGGKYPSANKIRNSNPIRVVPSESYCWTVGLTANDEDYVFFYDANMEYLGRISLRHDTSIEKVFTTPSDCGYINFSVNNTTYNNDISINYPSTETEYVPYTGTSYPYTLGQSVYGGTVDLATGVLTVDRAVVTLNDSETWAAGNANQGYYTQRRTLARLIDYSDSIICDRLETYNNYASNAYMNADSGITGFFDVLDRYPTNNWIYAKGGGATTVEEFKTWLASNPLQVVYKLATPTTVQLTPQEVKTLLGYNNISSTGTVDVIYHADTKLYVDKMTNVDNNIIAPTEADFVATRNYTVNDLVIVNDTLYKVTSNIQNGGTITPNSNVQQTTLGALIKALS